VTFFVTFFTFFLYVTFAITFVFPAFLPVIFHLLLTVAIFLSLEDHVTFAPFGAFFTVTFLEAFTLTVTLVALSFNVLEAAEANVLCDNPFKDKTIASANTTESIFFVVFISSSFLL
jgi:hypothetical protein